MRGVRTFDRLYNGKAHKLGYAIPSWLMGDNLGDPSDSTALPARWEPTARDVSDVEWGVLKWTAHLDRLDGEIIRLRAALIPWSYSQIGGVLKISKQTAHKRYRSAIRQVHRTALASTI